jgi:hypothetical protein
MAARTPIIPLHWDMILKSIYEGSCVPFLGAAANITNATRNYSGLPLGPEVALRLIGKMIGVTVAEAKQLAEVTVVSDSFKQQGLDEDLARLWVHNLPRVALHVEVQGNGDRPFLTGSLREILADQMCQPSKLLHVLSNIPVRLIVTTNFDQLLERALNDALAQAWSVTPDDVKDVKSVVTKLQAGADALSQHLEGQLSAATRNALAAYDGASDPPDALKTELAADLDRLVHGPSLYDPQRFAHVHLGDETRNLLGTAAAERLLRLNRLLLEDAYPNEIRPSRKPYQLVVQPVEGFSEEEGKRLLDNPPPDDVPVIYKIHGSFAAPGPAPAPAAGAGVVITEEDYIQFLTVINEHVKGVPTHIVERLTFSTLLFLGYSLDDWDFRTLHKALIEQRLSRHQRRTAFAIQWHPPKFWVEYWKPKGVQIYDCDIYDFAEDLEDMYKEKYGSLSARAPSPQGQLP